MSRTAASRKSFAPPARPTYKARRALQIAIEIDSKWPTYVPGVEQTRLLAPDGIQKGLFNTARRLVRSGRKDLIEMVLSDRISLHRAEEIVTKGERHVCQACKGAGYVFKLDGARKNNREGSEE